MTKALKISGGLDCPKCGDPMQRFKHGETWRPRLGHSWFLYWDRCKPCAHFQHYYEALQPSKTKETAQAYRSMPSGDTNGGAWSEGVPWEP